MNQSHKPFDKHNQSHYIESNILKYYTQHNQDDLLCKSHNAPVPYPTIHHSEQSRWPAVQIPQCTSPISHNSPFRTEICPFLFWMVHCGIWDWCIVGFVRLVFTYHIFNSQKSSISPPHMGDLWNIPYLYFGHNWPCCNRAVAYHRADSRLVPSQLETALLCNNVSHWPGQT